MNRWFPPHLLIFAVVITLLIGLVAAQGQPAAPSAYTWPKAPDEWATDAPDRWTDTTADRAWTMRHQLAEMQRQTAALERIAVTLEVGPAAAPTTASPRVRPVTAAELKSVNGIGDALAERILEAFPGLCVQEGAQE